MARGYIRLGAMALEAYGLSLGLDYTSVELDSFWSFMSQLAYLVIFNWIIFDVVLLKTFHRSYRLLFFCDLLFKGLFLALFERREFEEIIVNI